MKRKLVKKRENRMIFGICAGLADYFGIDAAIVRLAFAVLSLFGGAGIFLYIAAEFIMPWEEA